MKKKFFHVLLWLSRLSVLVIIGIYIFWNVKYKILLNKIDAFDWVHWENQVETYKKDNYVSCWQDGEIAWLVLKNNDTKAKVEKKCPEFYYCGTYYEKCDNCLGGRSHWPSSKCLEKLSPGSKCFDNEECLSGKCYRGKNFFGYCSSFGDLGDNYYPSIFLFSLLLVWNLILWQAMRWYKKFSDSKPWFRFFLSIRFWFLIIILIALVVLKIITMNFF